MQLCPCGLPEHYGTQQEKDETEEMIAAVGPTIGIFGNDGVQYAVPRTYQAQHGINVGDLAELAEKYGWPPVT
jgi:hypothetical protein